MFRVERGDAVIEVGRVWSGWAGGGRSQPRHLLVVAAGAQPSQAPPTDWHRIQPTDAS